MIHTESLERACRADPFRPFAIHMADGRKLPVPRPEFLAFNPKGHMALVMDESDGSEWVDLFLVSSLSFEAKDATSK